MPATRAQKSPVFAVGIAALVGMVVYSMRTTKSPTNPARDKRDLGLQGAGIGANASAGASERGRNPATKPEKSPAPLEKLPSGGLGHGTGAGGASGRSQRSRR